MYSEQLGGTVDPPGSSVQSLYRVTVPQLGGRATPPVVPPAALPEGGNADGSPWQGNPRQRGTGWHEEAGPGASGQRSSCPGSARAHPRYLHHAPPESSVKNGEKPKNKMASRFMDRAS